MIKQITIEWLKEQAACRGGIEWFQNQILKSSIPVLESLIKQKQYDWASWLIVRVMERKQYLGYAIFAAEQVIGIYEKDHPNDNRPRKAIESAKAVLKNDTEENRAAARAAARAAVWSTAWAAWAAWAAWDAARAAARAAAWDAARGARDARAAARGAAGDAARAAAGDATMLKILNYGLKLLEEK